MPELHPPDSTTVKRYNTIKLRLTIADLAMDIVLIALLAFSGISRHIVAGIAPHLTDPYMQFLAFLGIIGAAGGLIGLPLDFYGSFIIEHRYALSNQTMGQWAVERLKSTAVGMVLGIPVALGFLYFLTVTGDSWWLYTSGLIFAIAVLLARLAPVLLFPLFYKFSPIEDGAVKDAISSLLERYSISIKGIFTFDLSRETKKANAGFMGMGRGRRIVLSDTLLSNFSASEIAVVFAHEAGHYLNRHIVKNVLFGGVVIFASFFVCAALYRITWQHFGFDGPAEIAAIPILFFYLTLTGLVIMPLSNAISRHYEYQADRFALEATRDPAAFRSCMEKLADQNLADRDPHPLVEIFLYSHPSLNKRIALADQAETR